jgi:topoisomerase-4 subunit A
MQFHPHGDASIGDALVQMGQKDLLVDCQGNWGNILTGDRAAAPRYIEARLSKFALDVVFNPKTTDWQLSYDGRNKEPITLPAKFPLLLAQGAEGIAVGLSSKILPHNLVEICDAAIAYLRGEEFHLYPDFPTGGSIDVAKYNDGQRGGTVKVRAKIEKLDQKTIVIREIPFSKTTSTLIDSILKAIEKGKIKAKKVDDNTAAEVEIQVHLAPGVSSDKTIDALYAFSDCEINISPNCCVIEDIESVISLKAETHNFPTTVEPFNGAATGTGGEIRDRMGGGVGSWPIAGTAVYMTAYPRLKDDDNLTRDWEDIMPVRKWLYQTPEQILIKASNGV